MERNSSIQNCTVEILLIAGHDLVSRDSNGKSDPYVKFKQDGRELARSRIIAKTLNPVWNDHYTVRVKRSPNHPIMVKVFDHDFGLHDDDMGSAEIDTMCIDLNERSTFKLFLTDPTGRSKEEYMGYIEVEIRVLDSALIPDKAMSSSQAHLNQPSHSHSPAHLASQTQTPVSDNSDRVSLSSAVSRTSLMTPTKSSRGGSVNSTPTLFRRVSSRGRHSEWSAVVSVVLIEAENISGKDANSLPDSFCKIKLGTEKYKSKVFPKSKNPRWLEQFCLYMFDGQSHVLDISVLTQQFTRRILLGRTKIDLKNIDFDKTHPYDLQLEDGTGRIRLRVTVNNVRGGSAAAKEGRSAAEDDSGIHADFLSLRSSKHTAQRSASMDSDSYSVYAPYASSNQESGLANSASGSGASGVAGASGDDNNRLSTGLAGLVFASANYMQQTTQVADKRRLLHDKYSLKQTLVDLDDVGFLSVRVYRAEGLLSADINGFSDPFCVLEFENDRVQTHTIYKTLDPVWNRTFTFVVRDLHSVLDLTVFDEDSDRKHEFLGKLSIPLHQMQNNVKSWYGLKDRSLNKPSQGGILLEFELIVNHVRAAVRTLKPKEVLYRKEVPKLKIAILRRNIARLTTIVEKVIAAVEFIDSCIQWESPLRTFCAFLIFELFVYNFELYLIPLTIAALIMWSVFCRLVLRNDSRDETASSSGNDNAGEEDDDKNEDKRSLRERLQTLQDTCLKVQVTIGQIASFLERGANVFGCQVPWLSYFGIILLAAATLLLYFIPLRRILLVYGVYKFSKKKLRPNALDNNEVADFISRSPDNIEIDKWKIFPYKPNDAGVGSGGGSGSGSGSGNKKK